MMDKIEMSLDDIIKSNKKGKVGNRRGGGAASGGGFKRNNTQKGSPGKKFGGIAKGRGRGGITRSKYTRGDVNSAWKHDMFDGPGRKAGGVAGAILATTKLLVSNLDYSVSDADITELFTEFGHLKSASVHYDRSGRSLGTADVIFERRNDALKAMKTYNGVPLDGRPMSIQVATSEIPQAPIRKAPSFATNKPRGQTIRKGAPAGRRFGGGGGRGGSARGGGQKRERKTEVSIDQLNAELDAYTMQA